MRKQILLAPPVLREFREVARRQGREAALNAAMEMAYSANLLASLERLRDNEMAILKGRVALREPV